MIDYAHAMKEILIHVYLNNYQWCQKDFSSFSLISDCSLITGYNCKPKPCKLIKQADISYVLCQHVGAVAIGIAVKGNMTVEVIGIKN